MSKKHSFMNGKDTRSEPSVGLFHQSNAIATLQLVNLMCVIIALIEVCQCPRRVYPLGLEGFSHAMTLVSLRQEGGMSERAFASQVNLFRLGAMFQEVTAEETLPANFFFIMGDALLHLYNYLRTMQESSRAYDAPRVG